MYWIKKRACGTIINSAYKKILDEVKYNLNGGNYMGIKETLLSFMKEEAYRPMDIQELVIAFDINPDEYKVFKRALKVMELEGSIVRTKKDKYAVP